MLPAEAPHTDPSPTPFQQALLWTALLVWPFGLFLVAAKLVVVARSYDRVWLKLVYDDAVRSVVAGWFIPLVIFAVVLAVSLVLGWRWLRRRRPAWPPGVLAAGVVVVALIGVEASLWLGFGAYKAVLPRLYALFRGDVLFLIGYAVGGLMLLTACRGHWAVRLLLLLATGVLMLVAALASGYYLTTGSVGDLYLMQYALRRFGQVGPSLLNAVRGWNVVWLAVPVLAMALVAVLARRPSFRRWAHTRPATWRRPLRPSAVALLAAVALLLAVPPRPDLAAQYAPFTANVYARLLGGVVAGPRWAAADFEALAAAAPPFDTRGLRLAVRDTTAPRSNVVVILLESLRARSVGAYGGSWGVTPFLDSLAAHAVVAAQMYSNVPYTADALVALFHGIYPNMTGRVYYDAVPYPALPGLLKPLGYRSAFFSSAILRVSEAEDVLLRNMGFDVVQGGGMLPRDGFEALGYSGYEEHITLAPGLRWIDAARQDGAPFLAVFQTQAPHHDYRTPSWFTPTRYTDADAEFNRYLNTVRYVDDFLRDLFTAIEARGLLASTAVVLVGDHGEAFGEHGFRYHANALWEDVIHVPMLIYAPATQAPRTVAGPYQQVDVLPTVVDLLGLQAEGGEFPGHSLLQPAPGERTLYFSAAAPNQYLALRRGAIKYLYPFRRRPMQVFDLAADPEEQIDLAARYSREALDAVELELLLWRQQVNDLYRPLAEKPE